MDYYEIFATSILKATNYLATTNSTNNIYTILHTQLPDLNFPQTDRQTDPTNNQFQNDNQC